MDMYSLYTGDHCCDITITGMSAYPISDTEGIITDESCGIRWLCSLPYEIKDVEVVVPDKVVKVYFCDGGCEKAVCQEPDVFSLEQAISICIAKHLIGGSSKYNNAIRHGVKIYQKKLEAEATKKDEEERIAKKRAKRLAYKEKRAEKRAKEEARLKEEKREEEIRIQTEAYIRAMEYMSRYGKND